jgi:hypothetical protein
MSKKNKDRLEYLREQLNNECISYGELAELSELAPHIAPDDVQLLEAAGVPEQKINLFCRFVWHGGWLTAVFMRSSAGRRYSGSGHWLRGCYQHVGQHGECTDNFVRMKRATPAEYAELKSELEAIGYNVTVV